MTRARIMRVNSRQKRVNQIRASFVKDARRQMRVDTRSLAGAQNRALLHGTPNGRLTLLDAGGGSRSPPYHINVVPRKMLKERVADFFLLFLNM